MWLIPKISDLKKPQGNKSGTRKSGDNLCANRKNYGKNC